MKTIYDDMRGSRRKKQQDAYCVLDEGPQKYKVYEISSDGFSFLCPNEACHFQKWQVIHYITILNSESVEIVNAKGRIVHVTDFSGELKQIGIVYAQKSLDRTISGKVRAPRKFPRVRLNVRLRAAVNGEVGSLMGYVMDYTATTARIAIHKTASAKVPVAMDDEFGIVISANDKVLLDGVAMVVRKKDDDSEIIVHFTDAMLDVSYLEVLSDTIEYTKSVQNIFSDMSHYDPLFPEYKAVINDFRMYLFRVKSTLDQLDAQRIYQTPWEKELCVKGIEDEFIDKFNHYLGRFNRIADTVDAKEKLPYKLYFRENINYYVHASPIGASMIDKDNGYSGDFETIKQFFENQYAGETLYAKLMSKYICSTGAVKAHQERISFLHEELVKNYDQAKNDFSFLSLGSGPAEEVLRFIGKHTFEKNVLATLLDMDAFALADFSDRLQYLPKKNFVVDLVNMNIIRLLRQKSNPQIRNDYQISYCAGLFDYISDTICRQIIRLLIRCTRPEGTVIVTNVHPDNFHRNIMDYGFEWEIIHRNERDMQALAPPDYPVQLFSDHTNTNIFMKITIPRNES